MKSKQRVFTAIAKILQGHCTARRAHCAMVMVLIWNPATSSRRSVAQFGTLGKFLDNQPASSSVCNKNFRLGKIIDQLHSNILAHLLTMMMNEPMKTTMVKTRMTAPITLSVRG